MTSCATLSTVHVGPYTAQNTSKLNCSIDVNKFIYQPYENSKIRPSGGIGDFAKYGGLSSPNRVLSSDANEIYLTIPVAAYIQIGTALELERSGVMLDSNNSEYTLSATVNELKVDAISRTVTWFYSITYSIKNNRTDNIVATKKFEQLQYKTGKGRYSDIPYSDVINYLVYAGYTELISEMKSNNVCIAPKAKKPTPKPVAKPAPKTKVKKNTNKKK